MATTSASYGRAPFIIAPIGPRYLPCSVIAAWRCFTRTSGFTCACASSEAPASAAIAVAAANSLVLIRFSSEWSFYDQKDGKSRHAQQHQREPWTGKARHHTSGRVRRHALHAGKHRADKILFHEARVIQHRDNVQAREQQQQVEIPGMPAGEPVRHRLAHQAR